MSSHPDHQDWASESVKKFTERAKVGFTNVHESNFAQPATLRIMSPVPREELNAKLEAVEARMDARMAGVESKLDTALAEMRADRHRFDTLGKNFDDLKSDVKSAESSSGELLRSVRLNAWLAALTVIGVLIAVLSFGQDRFSSGRDQGSSLAQAAADIKQTQEQLKAMQERLEHAAPGTGPTAASK